MYVLAESINDIRQFIGRGSEDDCFGMDTETTGLNTRRAGLVGISLSNAPNQGIYIPIGHKMGSNLPIDVVVDAFKEGGLGETYECIFYHAKFDLNILQARAKWYPRRFQDALEIVYLKDPDRKVKNLKTVAKEDLGMDMARFESLFTPEEVKAKILDISTKLPSRCVDYACADADAPLRIWRAETELRKEQDFAIKIDTKLIEVVRRMEHNGGMVLNQAYIDEQMQVLRARAEAMQEQIWRGVGYKFEIASPKQLGIALFEKMGIPSPGLTRGKNPQHKTDAESLEKLSHQYPIIKLIIAYRSVVKARETYFAKLQKLNTLKMPPRFQFNMFAAPTFRFSAPGGDPEVDGGCGLNIQAVSNGEAMDMMAVNLSLTGGSDEYLKDVDQDDLLLPQTHMTEADDETVAVDPRTLPWTVDDESTPPKRMCFREVCGDCPAKCKSRGIDTTRRVQKNLKLIPSVRQAFMAPEGYTLVSFDYDRQELVIGANMSKEPKWLRALANGDDLHQITASDAFGIPLDQFKAMEKNPDQKEEYKRKRGIGKILNFATFYGATSYTLARKADISQAQADKVFDGFVNGLRTLFSWIDKVHAFARKNGYTTTYFGRKRKLRQFYEDAEGRPLDRKMQAFGDRSAVNTAIQGTAAEVTRIAMVKVDKALKDAGYKSEHIRFVMQLHDELTFIIKDELVKQIVPIIKANMEFKVKSWDVQLTAGPKVGRVWGLQKTIESKDYEEWLKAA